MTNKSIADRCADNIRILSAAMVEKANSGHPGGAMGGADFINILFSEFLNFDPADPSWALRDRFYLDPGHMSPMLYSILTLTGHFRMEDLMNFRQWKSTTPGHPELDVMRGIENTSGPLGQGHAMAVGSAIAERFLVARFGEAVAHKTFAFLSDGSVQEEISQGAGRIAGFLGLSNLVMFYDSNDIQLSTETSAVSTEDTARKYESWNWHVQTINGNDEDEIREALHNAIAETHRPSLIIGKTIMGYGALAPDGTRMERLTSTHGQPLSKAGISVESTIRNLGGDPANPFSIFPDVAKYYASVVEARRLQAKTRKEAFGRWKKQNSTQGLLWDLFQSDKTPPLDFSAVTRKPNAATRSASGNVLAYFSERIGNMIVMSADLSNSDKTDGFLKGSKAFSPGDFSGGFLHAGVSELTMAALANGVALHGGVFVACGTFFVFSDFMKPAIRLAALMELPVKYVFTHDSFRVGEDGPTHQPVEHEAQLRLMEHLKNHSGRMSLLALRPCDYEETIVAWRMAMENTLSPSALILSRQDIPDIPAFPGNSRSADAMKAARGAYVVRESNGQPDVILIASGSEVGTLYKTAEFLENEGINARVVSVISEGLFRQQDLAYQDSILLQGIPRFGLTAGLPVTLQGLVMPNGRIFGLDHFGYSAPYKVLDQQFGFTAERIAGEIRDFLRK